ncbi:flagellar biosynthetic protein FliO [Bellilinea caldifistulae]|uniref:Flagellar protein n=1 Tax=Bellilinea caldifistulae TaxID=360411 RepID=A0A0N8GNA2_9CHLR|nr:flagellar biosynthetic protein FliO [Bellilinea caldifistulae]KPL77530.1 hypothetical protein AC812_03000 [Bellilinea caldifistulae]GAP09694.1 flagellar biosynthetic protein FliO [Bellilinea caldifistulae]
MTALRNRLQQWFAAASRKQKIQAVLLLVGVLASFGLVISGGAAPQQPADEPSTLYFAGVVVKLIGVLLLIVGCGVIVMRWARNPRRLSRGGQMMVVETIRLSPKQALHLVRVGGQQFLVGATDQNISLISQVELADPADDEQPIPIGQDFNRLLQGFLQVRSSGKE